MGARPGDGLWRVIPGLGQAALLVLFNLNPNAPPSLQVPQAFNVLILGLNALLLYKIYRQFFTVGFALAGVALYSSLVNTNVYLRHLLPYDHALFFFLLALWLLLSQPECHANSRQGLVGLLSGFSYLVYPGYFMGVLVLLGLGLVFAAAPAYRRERRFKVVQLKPIAAQLAGLFVLLGLFEILAQLSGTSYFASSRYIATTITQGSYAEGFSFIAKYFWQVEGAVGAGLLLLAAIGLVLSIRQLPVLVAPRSEKVSDNPLLLILLLIVFGAWVGYAAAVQFGHSLVFYGRIVHFFVPFIVLAAVAALSQVAGQCQAAKRILQVGSVMVALWHFGAFSLVYRAVKYPGDVAYAHGIHDARQIESIETTACGRGLITYRVFGPRLRNQPTAKQPRFQLVNFAYLYPLRCYLAPRPRIGRVVSSVPYFMKFTPYQFEGHDEEERILLQKQNYVFEIFTVHL
ncbi:hypothetical protein I2I05_05080 [Hymenobacter sp. BT683]|uniref:Uncharacterized protein n=1 Tax=Hymenobacter jeongseonensis TaxID=2791027 RepID=A0ABS0IEH9_9BACT|nr:hypothetical protein [Hymenobacter jeongseonensis]MBF9236762.1 hypothetical protein [Hymenobacter jeongseonensis]